MSTRLRAVAVWVVLIFSLTVLYRVLGVRPSFMKPQYFIPLLIVALYTLTPVLLKSTFWQKTTFEFKPLQGLLPPQAQPFLQCSVDAMTPLGFTFAGYYEASGLTNVPTRIIVGLLVNRKTGDRAGATFCTASVPNRAGNTIEKEYVEFSRSCNDGRLIETNNNRITPLLFRDSAYVVNRFPWIQDLHELWQLHQSIVAWEAPGVKPVLPRQGEEARFVQDVVERILQMQERAGYFAMDRNGEVYRLTWAAAFRFAFRSLPPMKQILASREERRARALLARMKSEPIKLATAIG